MNNYRFFLLNNIFIKKHLVPSILILTTLILMACSTASSKPVTSVDYSAVNTLSKERELLLSTLNYFSEHYPYSTSQVEDFYGHQFKLTEVAYGLNSSFEIDQRTNNHPLIQNIDVRTRNTDSKLLIVDFKKPICLNSSDYKDLVSEYKKSYNSHFQSYYRVLDKKNGIGKVFLTNRLVVVGIKDHIRGYSSYSNQSNNSRPLKTMSELEKENNSRCITNLTFNTFDSMKLKRYSR